MKHERFQRALATHSFQYFSSEPSYQREVMEHTLTALRHDEGKYGDLTTNALVPQEKRIKAKLIAKSSGILAGMEELFFFIDLLKKKKYATIAIQTVKKDGSVLKKGDVLATLKGYAKEILKIERTALNLLQRMSGVATLTHKYVQRVPSHVLITPTRKTPWGLLDKKACTVGGGGTHRLYLSDAVLVKDTHLQLLDKNFEKIFQKLSHQKKIGRFIEIEVETVNDALECVRCYRNYFVNFSVPFCLMFDNMKPSEIARTVHEFKRRDWFDNILLEASGGVTLENIAEYARCGVDIISVGALTHSASALDISLRILAPI